MQVAINEIPSEVRAVDSEPLAPGPLGQLIDTMSSWFGGSEPTTPTQPAAPGGADGALGNPFFDLF